MVGTLVHQLTRNLNQEQIKTAGFDAYFVDHTTGVYPQFASGYPWSASTMQVTGDVIADLTEDLAADGATIQEQRGRKPLKTLDCWLDPLRGRWCKDNLTKFSMGQAVSAPSPADFAACILTWTEL